MNNEFDERSSHAIVQTVQSIIPMEPCGVEYWILSSVQVPLAIGFTAWIVSRKESLQDQTLVQEVRFLNIISCEKFYFVEWHLNLIQSLITTNFL